MLNVSIRSLSLAVPYRAVGFLKVANPNEPKWNEANPKAERYVKAWKAKRGL